MPLKLVPVTLDDLDACMHIQLKAFAGPYDEALWPNGFGEDAFAWFRAQRTRWIKEPGRNGVYKYVNKIVDTDLPDDALYNKIISFGIWTFVPHEVSHSQLAAQVQDEEEAGKSPGCDSRIWDKSLATLYRDRREVWGSQKYAALDVLATLPEHQQRGAGGLHCQWGVDKADDENLPLWVEASREGKALYEKYGWHVVRQNAFNTTKFGLAPKNIVDMLRDPKHVKKESRFEKFKRAIIVLGGGPGVLATPM